METARSAPLMTLRSAAREPGRRRNLRDELSSGIAEEGINLTINEGRGCAREVDKYLMGDTVLP